MLGHSIFWTARLLSYELLWLTHPMEGINDGFLASCQVCSLLHSELNWDNWTKLKQFNDTWGNLCRCFEFSRWLVCDTQFKTFMPHKIWADLGSFLFFSILSVVVSHRYTSHSAENNKAIKHLPTNSDNAPDSNFKRNAMNLKWESFSSIYKPSWMRWMVVANLHMWVHNTTKHIKHGFVKG